MLLDLRDGIRNSKWLKYLLVTVICIPFALFGVNSYFNGHGPDYAAKVNGEKVSLNVFQNAYQQQRGQLSQMFGGQIPAGFDAATLIGNQAMGSVITNEVIRQSTVENQLAVSDDDLANSLIGIDGFSVDGRFDKERYQLQLQSMGISAAEFESQYRSDIITRQFSDSVVSTGFALPTENSRIESLRSQMRNLSSITFNLQAKADSIEVSDEDVATYYEENKAQFNNPQKVTVEYLELKIDDLKSTIDVTDADLNGYYEQNKNRWVTPDKRDASHILLAVDSDASDSVVDEKLELANSLLARVSDGESFEDLAKEFSDDPGSGANGGSLGEFDRGVMVPPFEEAVFAMEEGAISEPVRSDFGFHIIRLDKIIPERGQSFEEAREEVEDQFRVDTAETNYFTASDLLSNASYENSDSLQPAADETGLEIKTSDWIDENVLEGIGQYRQVLTAALSDEVLNQGLNSEVLEVAENHSIVLRTLDHEEAKPKPLEEVKEDVVKIIQQQRATEELTTLAGSVSDEMASGAEPAAVAAANDGTYQEAVAVGRNDPEADRELSRALFAMPKPAEGSSSFETVTTASGDIAIAIFGGIAVPVAAEETTEETMAAVGGTSAPASTEFTALVSALEAAAKVERNEAILQPNDQGGGGY